LDNDNFRKLVEDDNWY